jgi:hypothetical protein
VITEFACRSESVTAVITSHMETGENFDGAIVIGVYPEDLDEIWIETQGVRTNIQVADIPAFCKQLKRAGQIAQEQTVKES